ncbi:MAG: hypothetical protein R3C05_15780 [Pirellulaceae bacterium]
MRNARTKEPRTNVKRFQVGDNVRVRHGVMDSDYPDMPLGGWEGTVVERHEDELYTIQWSEETLKSVHPVYRSRCQIDGLDEKRYYLSIDELEPHSGEPLDIQHPQEITTRPLSPTDQDDRIRMIFGLTSNDVLPDVGHDSLRTYHGYLSENCSFPFMAKLSLKFGQLEVIKITSLGDPDDDSMIDLEDGIFCNARHQRGFQKPPLHSLKDIECRPNQQLIVDFATGLPTGVRHQHCQAIVRSTGRLASKSPAK